MPTYTMIVTLSTWAENQNEAYTNVKHAIKSARKAELEFIDAEITDTIHDDEPANVEVNK